ncbi:single-stranded DNA-binding protein [Cellulomonas sp. NPDC089187]|uniref:single-stranded DNA-binding protein n=1 Tax=Cellulomonas sp. NPDC089187 TaxID=3154970 RepID=UPI0034485CAA
MSVRDPQLTLVGWAGSTPKLYPGQGENPVAFAQFRLGQTTRVLNRDTGELTDGPTSWYTVKVFRDLAQNVSESIRQGEPVVVHGRLRIEEWTNADQQVMRTPVVVADAVGTDLRWGTSRFVRTVRQSAPETGEEDTGVAEALALHAEQSDQQTEQDDQDAVDVARLPYAVSA